MSDPTAPEPVLQVRVRGQLPLDLNGLLRMSKDQKHATRRRREFQENQRMLMRVQNRLPREPLEGPLVVRFCRIHKPRNAVDIDNAASGLKTILDGLAEEGAILHDGHKQIPELERVWQATTRKDSEVGFFLELARPPALDRRATWNAACSLLAMAEKALRAEDEKTLRQDLTAATQAARTAGLGHPE